MRRLSRLSLLVMFVAATCWAEDYPRDARPSQRAQPGAASAERTDDAGARPDSAAVFRRPVALAVSPDGSRLYVANRRSGSLSMLDLSQPEGADPPIVGELAVGKRLADLAALSDGRLLAVDEEAGSLCLIGSDDAAEWKVEARISVAPYPVAVVVAGEQAIVSSLWSRRLTAVRVHAAPTAEGGERDASPLSACGSLRLPFAPRAMALLPRAAGERQRLVAADAFGGRLAVVALDERGGLELELLRELPAHNIRGLAVDAASGKLLVSQQILNDRAQTSSNDVHWGILMMNIVRWLRLDHLLDPEKPLLDGSHAHPLGGPGGAGGDPGPIAQLPDGSVAVCVSGVGRVAYGREADYSLELQDVGSRPVAAAPLGAGRVAVANQFDDSVSIVDLALKQTLATISLGPQPEPTLVDQGERLFYDARLSLDGWFSCHSCHTDGHSNGQLADNLGDGEFGAAKRVLSLLGTGSTPPWAWNGESADLDGQARKSIEQTLRGPSPEPRDVAALGAFVINLPPPPALGPLDGDDPAAVARGETVFKNRGCERCHAPPTYSSPLTHDVGLPDSHGQRRFNPPSLRGVSQGGPYFHDNSARALEDVVQQHPPGAGEISPADEADLVRFLRSL